MVEGGRTQLDEKQPLGVSEDLAHVVHSLHSLWHEQLLDKAKKPGWGREFDQKSDALLSEAGEILSGRGGISEDMYKFGVAYGKLVLRLEAASMSG
ncbi:hypothetical protein NUW58_g7947 [Xylaria curta]|uniref:Uncharacterized protein n=1 Tax=Xylaria curta TaxID=42375 RepID=A0ACC1NDR5_9PEZI|nr:hypothetical protein NUW58_g7947 [Xylaria curta]